MKQLFKRILLVILIPILLTILTIVGAISIPIWIFTGKGILNNTGDYMILQIIKFLD